MEIHPKALKGSWDAGYVLDVHTISSTMIGYNEFGHPEFDTQRSELGELVYRLKYKGDKSAIPLITETVVNFLKSWEINPDLIVPMPPSKQRSCQPVVELASELGKALQIPCSTSSLTKTKMTPQMKDIGDFSARTAALKDAFTVVEDIHGKKILLFDDLFQSGATMNVVAHMLKKQGYAEAVYALVLTRTRG